MMLSISYEDALIAATGISECTNNVMTVRIFILIVIMNILK
jgi:hypothetical protein